MKTSKMIIISILAALTFVLTRFTAIPIPGTQGYVHLGDTVIYITAVIFGGAPAAIVGAIGGALSDMTYAAVWILPTLIIKGIMGYVCGKLATAEKWVSIKNTFAMVIAGVIMSLLYSVATGILYGNWITAFVNTPFDIIQFGSGAIISNIILALLSKSKIKLNK